VALTVAQLVARVTADTSGFYKSMAIMNSTLIRTGSFASRALAGIGLAATGIGILSLKAAGDFQQGMNIVEAVSNANRKQMAALREEALGLGRDFKLPNVSARDAADAMVELSKAGMSVRDTLGATRGTLQLGLAANIGFADSAKLTARALKAFDLPGNNAVRIANLLAAGANKSTAEITDLALGMQNAGAQFHGAGFSVEDLVASLAELSDNALSGEYAGTALKTMIIRLTSPTDKAAKVMKDYGISVFDASGTMKSMPAIIKQFQSGLGGLTQQQREQALTTIFGVRANQAMRILMGEGAAAYVKYRDAVTGTNAAQKMAEARTKGFNGAMGALGSAVQTLAIELGTYLLPAAEKVIRAMANFVNSIDPEKIAAAFRPIGDAIAWFKNLADHSVALRAALVGVGAALGAFLIIGMVTSLVEGLIGVVIALNAALLANPVVLVAAALVGLGAALYFAYTRSETFRNVVNAAFAFLKDLLPALQNFARSVIQTFAEIWNYVGPIVRTLANEVRARFEAIYNFIRDNMDRIKAIISAAWTIISTIVKTSIQNLLSVIKIFAAILRGDWGEAWEQAKAIVSRTLAAIVTIVRAGVSLLVNAAILLGKGIIAGIKEGLRQLGAEVKAALQIIVGAIGAIVSIAYHAALSIGKGIVDGVLAGIGDIGSAVYNKLAGGIQGAIDKAKGLFGIFSPSKVTSDQLGKPLGQGVTAGMLLGLQDLPTKMSDKMREAVTAAQNAIQAQQGTFEAAWSRFTGDVFRLFDAQTEAFKTRSEKLLAAFDLRQVVAENKKRIQELVDAVKSAQQELSSFMAQPGPDALQQKEGESADEYAARRLQAQQEWDDKYKQLLTAQQDAQTALQEEKQNQRLAAQRLHLEAQAAQERRDYEARRDLMKRHLEDKLADLVAELKQEPEKHKFYQNQIIKLLQSYGVQYRGAGIMLGRSFASGLLQAQDEVARAAKALAQTVEQYLATHSPTEKGPMASLDTWWSSFGTTLVSGLDTRPVSGAAASIASLMGSTSPGSSFAGTLGSVGGFPATGLTLYVDMTVQGSVIRQQDLADEIYELVSKQTSRGKVLTP
jgi:TP901 family phage tail tape measure protein